MTATPESGSREVRDVYGRVYRIGADAEQLTGHTRRTLLVAAWACMAVTSPLQYAFGAAVPGLREAHGWGFSQTLWLLALFVAVQACTAVPAAWLHRSARVTPGQFCAVGGALVAAALLALAHADSYLLAVLGYAVAGGVGAGLVYATCLTTTARWFPERRAASIGSVTGGFAIGAVPVLVVVAVLGGGALPTVLTVTAGAVLATTLVAGRVLKDPPAHWWPAAIDPRSWAVDHQLNRSAAHNMPAVRHYTTGEAIRTGVLPVIWLLLAAITAVSLFGIAFIAGYAVDAGLGLTVAAFAAAVLAAANGVVRSAAAQLSDRFGRKRALVWVLALEGGAQFAVVAAGESGHAWAFVACALLLGLGGGAFYAIFAEVVLEYFGHRSLVQNQAVLYSAKAVGGLVGVGVPALTVAAVGYPPAFVAAGFIGLAAAVMVRFLRQPGRPALPAGDRLGVPTVPGHP